MRLKLSESPVFQAMKEEGELAGNPFIESFTYPGNKKRIFIALFGVAAGLTVIWYTAMFSGLNFLKSAARLDDTGAELIVGAAALVGMGFYVYFGHLSDRVGRKKPIVIGYALTLLLLFPTFWAMGAAANPQFAAAAERTPVTVSGADCSFDPFAKDQATQCGRLLGDLTTLGVPYRVSGDDHGETRVFAGKGYMPLGAYAWDDKAARTKQLTDWLGQNGYDFAKHKPGAVSTVIVFAALLVLMALSGATYGSVAALLTEMFPAKVRYSSMSIPYHIGAGYFGGFLPFIAAYIVAKTGNPYSGLWYTWAIVLIALIVGLWGLPNGPPRDFADDPT
jgi:MFS family permease